MADMEKMRNEALARIKKAELEHQAWQVKNRRNDRLFWMAWGIVLFANLGMLLYAFYRDD